MVPKAFLQGILLAASFGSLFVSAAPSLSLSLSGAKYVNAVGDLKVTATLTNTGDETVKVLHDPHGALSDMPADTFSIANEDGSVPNFAGIMVKYVPKVAAEEHEYTVLHPGQSVDVEHDLSSAYDFSSSGEGVYSIHANTHFYIVDPSSPEGVSSVYADSTPHIAQISGIEQQQFDFGSDTEQNVFNATAIADDFEDLEDEVALEGVDLADDEEADLAEDDDDVKTNASFRRCSSRQRRLIRKAAVSAQRYVRSAYNYARSRHGSRNRRYKLWFGRWSPRRYVKVLRAFKRMNQNRYSGYTYDCSCRRSGTYAYVHPDNYGTVYLCGAFWRAPLVGKNSKAGTIVHESSHFTRNAGTIDRAYGHDKCKALALRNPNVAVRNADSYEYYTENTA
ncbi:hypothetical protein D9613_009107 [Agrocybe pediades]|uniref:Lysine-specific metallo-endopeptidase domain-containing protein n=1 Tax=Agrocybe pediades TaxID=84607 RepID=A0A8H4VTD3_9AGAR|nr:hypothetical protein D9613_009107 [Agrocybe pediades]KAF9554405.1 zincin [Agrocybe pediades]